LATEVYPRSKVSVHHMICLFDLRLMSSLNGAVW